MGAPSRPYGARTAALCTNCIPPPSAAVPHPATPTDTPTPYLAGRQVGAVHVDGGEHALEQAGRQPQLLAGGLGKVVEHDQWGALEGVWRHAGPRLRGGDVSHEAVAGHTQRQRRALQRSV